MHPSEQLRSRVAVVVTLTAVVAAGCSRPPQRATPAAGEARATRFDSATVARLCATPDSATLVVGGCQLRDQAPPPELRRRPRP
ncbi:hypothetical protein [Roseisolibacter agri]|uniref:Uncharacterized protein n=1 Tax=Roseisolibacter agri TaxID=2014610 RepID=A0AA37QFC9_9BACT|nr:hypothetical protein [Roseisolibacter agri]GLC24713.1 hypothetical protein rosag_12260 [Roseisolibacter agri]